MLFLSCRKEVGASVNLIPQIMESVCEQYKDYINIVLIKGIYDKTELNAVRSNADIFIAKDGLELHLLFAKPYL